MNIGQIIRDVRLKKGLTQEDLAIKSGISSRTIQRIEQGKVDPRPYTLQTIADVLEVEYEVLINNASNAQYADEKEREIWLPLLHLSGLLLLLIPPLIIWILKKDENELIKKHGIDVINFQLSMLLIVIPSGILAFLVITIPIIVLTGVFSTVLIIINTIKVMNGQPYKYPFSIKFLKQ